MAYVKRGLKTIQLHTKPIDAHLSPLRVVRTVHSIYDARSVLQLSQADLGIEIGRILKVTALSQSTIANAEAGAIKLARCYIDAVGRLLATWLARQLQRDGVGIKVAVNSPWCVTAWARCGCGTWYELRRANWRVCGKCKGNR
jgi:hypothetical protein